MRWWSRSSSLFALALCAIYLVRAIYGWIGGVAEGPGRRDALWGDYKQALPKLERAAVGEARAELLWLTAQSRLGMWHDRLNAGAATNELRDFLIDASAEYTEAISMSPASGWYRAALADLYHQIERVERFQAGDPLYLLEYGPWAFVGRPGRVAIGLERTAIELEPTVFTLRDQEAFTLLDYKIRTEALQAVRASARVQPIFRLHAYKNLSPVPPDILDAFAAGARESLGHTPYLRPVLHHLALGRLELRRGDPEQAKRDLEASLEDPGDMLNRAEAHYYLGVVDTELGDYEQALEHLRQAELHPNFVPGSLSAQARVATLQGRPEEALILLRKARSLEPRRLDLALEYARIAGDLGEWDKAEAALRWAALVHSQSPAPLVQLARIYRAKGDRQAAKRVIDELEKMDGTEEIPDELRELNENPVQPEESDDAGT